MRSLLRRPASWIGAAALFAALVAAAAVASPAPTPPGSAAPSPLTTAVGSAPAVATDSPSAMGTDSPSATATDSPPATATDSPSASASGLAAATPLSPARGADIPAEASPKPTETDWRTAKTIALHRGAAPRCKLLLVREWLRVLCQTWVGVGLVAGSPKDVSMWTGGNVFNDSSQPTTTMVQFPLVRGSSRIMNFLTLDGGYDSVSFAEAGTMSVVWREGAADPVIGIYVKADLDK